VKPDRDIEALADKAIAGNEEAAIWLFMLAFDATQCLAKVAKKNPKILHSLTKKSPVFPAFICPNNSRDEEQKQILKACEVGKDSTFNAASTSAMKFETPAKRVALNFYRFMQDVRDGSMVPDEKEVIAACRALPDPSRNTFKQWNHVMLTLLPTSIADYPAQDWKNTIANKVTAGQQVDAIKKAISQALNTILPD
jgi:hypothetical protein